MNFAQVFPVKHRAEVCIVNVVLYDSYFDKILVVQWHADLAHRSSNRLCTYS